MGKDTSEIRSFGVVDTVHSQGPYGEVTMGPLFANCLGMVYK
jgi:hypothetical protein